jgi:hypothetical protein
MEKQLRWFVTVLAWIGAIAILGAVGRGALYFAFKDFAGGNCTDTEQKVLAAPAPNETRSVKMFHRECGGQYESYFVYISTGNPNKGYEYTPIIELENVSTGHVSVRWNGPMNLPWSIPTPQRSLKRIPRSLMCTWS